MNEVKYPVMALYETIQGEGVHQGKAALFMRLAGCDVACPWCDTKDSWNLDSAPERSIEDLLAECLQSAIRKIVITGGEPLMHDLNPLTKALHDHGFLVHLESSGAYPLSGEWDWICCSPKKFKPALSKIVLLADELKIVVANKSDLKWATTWAGKTKPQCKHVLQPEWNRREKMMPLIMEFVKSNPKWQISVQMHKYLNLP